MKLKCKIKKITPDPTGGQRVIVHLDVTNEDGKTWTRQVSIAKQEHPISLEEFSKGLDRNMLQDPDHSIRFLQEAMENDEEFNVEFGDGETPQWQTPYKTSQ